VFINVSVAQRRGVVKSLRRCGIFPEAGRQPCYARHVVSATRQFTLFGASQGQTGNSKLSASSFAILATALIGSILFAGADGAGCVGDLNGENRDSRANVSHCAQVTNSGGSDQIKQSDYSTRRNVDPTEHRPLDAGREKLMGKSQVDPTHCIETRNLALAERYIQCAEIVLQLRNGSRAEDRRSDCRIEERPGQGDLR
jgi:hypothetical protein